MKETRLVLENPFVFMKEFTFFRLSSKWWSLTNTFVLTNSWISRIVIAYHLSVLSRFREKKTSLYFVLSYSRPLTCDGLMGIEGAQQVGWPRCVCLGGERERGSAARRCRRHRVPPFKLPSALREFFNSTEEYVSRWTVCQSTTLF